MSQPKVVETKVVETKVVKKETISHPAVREFDNAKTFVARTAAFKGAINRFEIVWPIPATDEEAKARYDTTLSDLVTMGVQIISHRPDYGALFNGKDEFSPELHKSLQELADGYKCGVKREGKSAQTKAAVAVAKRVQDKASSLGFDNVDAMFEALEKLKKGKK
jgi:hypothetical protein